MNVCLIDLFTLVYWCMWMWWHSHTLFLLTLLSSVCFSFTKIVYIVSYVDIGGQHWWSWYSLWQPAIVLFIVSWYYCLLSRQINSLSLSLSHAYDAGSKWIPLCCVTDTQHLLSFNVHSNADWRLDTLTLHTGW